MTGPAPYESSRRRPPPRRRSSTGRWVALAAAGLLLFGLGAALGAALESSPSSGGSRTFVHTYGPLRPAPMPKTVTLTVTSP